MTLRVTNLVYGLIVVPFFLPALYPTDTQLQSVSVSSLHHENKLAPSVKHISLTRNTSRQVASTKSITTVSKTKRMKKCASPVPDNYLYRLPFPPGKKFYISAGPYGKKYHKYKYAVDFAMPVGTPVRAAREGVVLDVKGDGKEGARSSRSSSETNYIIIRHPDNTSASYLHLMTDGVLVTPGQEVNAGDLIGYSGRSGPVTGPHLHFEVFYTDCNGRYKSIPFAFFDENSGAVKPGTGMGMIAR